MQANRFSVVLAFCKSSCLHAQLDFNFLKVLKLKLMYSYFMLGGELMKVMYDYKDKFDMFYNNELFDV